ncbi:MAG: ABC transporter substrate-binding protein [Treponema sp.]|jgi:NitT/TauT family transport system substrate-binding protein|nr:ABC transporter substrate-binding protein [Treponema sp.]
MKIFTKQIFPFCILLCMAGFLAAQQAEKLTIYSIKGPSGVALIRLFENPPGAAGFDIKAEALAQADLMAAKFISGEAKIGILPPNVAAKIASSGKRIQVAAVTGAGMLSLLSADPSVRRLEDLKGKSVEVAGQGATPDYVFRKILLSKGINPDRDISLGYSLAYPEIAQSLIAGRVSIALLPEPFATMARTGNGRLNLVGDIQDEWAKLHAPGASSSSGSSANYPMTVLVVDRDFAAAHVPLMRLILDAVKDSVEWVVSRPVEAGRLVEKHELGLRAQAAGAAIPRSNYVFIPASRARQSLEDLFRAFLDFAPASIGGALPGDDFYYQY